MGVAVTAPGPGGSILIVKTASNTFKVIFAVPMRIALKIEFRDLPTGVAANIIEETNVGFTVVFTPQSVPVEFPKFSADAEF
jgi:hypothetical protein